MGSGWHNGTGRRPRPLGQDDTLWGFMLTAVLFFGVIGLVLMLLPAR